MKYGISTLEQHGVYIYSISTLEQYGVYIYSISTLEQHGVYIYSISTLEQYGVYICSISILEQCIVGLTKLMGLSGALWPGGETEALRRLQSHLERRVCLQSAYSICCVHIIASFYIISSLY